jgi:hypothetical protein
MVASAIRFWGDNRAEGQLQAPAVRKQGGRVAATIVE